MAVAVSQLENAARDLGRCEAQDGSPGLVPAQPGVGELEVATGLDAAWTALALGVRHSVGALFARAEPLPVQTFEIEGCLPDCFARDLARGGAGLRAAFPALRRRVIAIDTTPSQVLARVACRGRHLAPFFDLLAPTQRYVRFDVMHHVVLADNHHARDRVTLDLRAILVQLARPQPHALDSCQDE
jgi:hypothetical protein